MFSRSTLQLWPKWVVSLALSLLAFESLFVITRPITWLIAQVNADDFYYYLVLARHIAAGYGPTFDGVELTNGFHPFYLFLLTLLAGLPPDGSVFLIKAGLIVLLFFYNATGIVLAIGFNQQQRPDIGALAALAWLLNPWALAITLHGVEAPIATFFWAIIIFIFLAYRQTAAKSLKKASVLGLLMGLAILARTDSLLLLAAIMVSEFYRAWRYAVWRYHLILGAVVIAGSAFMVTLPWWWWNLQTFDMIIQVSGKAIFLTTHGFNWVRPAFILSKVTYAGQGHFARLLMYTTIPLLWAGFALWQNKQRHQPSQLGLKAVWRALDFAWLTVIALVLWYSGWQWNVQNWYLLSTILVFTIAAGFVWQQLIRQASASTIIKQAGGIIIFAGGLFLVGVYVTIGFGFPRQERGYYLAQWLNQHTEPKAVIGAWNSGVIGYFTHRNVVNLDGVVNNSVYHYQVAHQTSSIAGLMDYIKSRNITYVTDYEHLYIESPARLGLQLVYESPEYGFRVYRVNGYAAGK